MAIYESGVFMAIEILGRQNPCLDTEEIT